MSEESTESAVTPCKPLLPSAVPAFSRLHNYISLFPHCPPSPPPSSRERVVVGITDNTPAQHSSHHIWSLYKVRRNQQNCKCQCDSQADRQSCSPLSLCLSCYQLSTFILLYFTLDFFPRLLFFNAPASHSNVVDREDVKSSPL